MGLVVVRELWSRERVREEKFLGCLRMLLSRIFFYVFFACLSLKMMKEEEGEEF